MPYTIFRVQNGWIILKGDHSYLSSKDIPEAYVFTNVSGVAQFLVRATAGGE